MSERTSEWPSTYVSIPVCSRPQCKGPWPTTQRLIQFLLLQDDFPFRSTDLHAGSWCLLSLSRYRPSIQAQHRCELLPQDPVSRFGWQRHGGDDDDDGNKDDGDDDDDGEDDDVDTGEIKDAHHDLNDDSVNQRYPRKNLIHL